MKLVVAIVRPEKLTDVLEALFLAEVRGLTINRVQGHGGETEPVETYRGTTVKMALSEKIRKKQRLEHVRQFFRTHDGDDELHLDSPCAVRLGRAVTRWGDAFEQDADCAVLASIGFLRRAR